jgi:hypothetical protein
MRITDLVPEPLSFQCIHLLMSDRMLSSRFQDIVEQRMDGDKPSIPLAQPLKESLETSIYYSIGDKS